MKVEIFKNDLPKGFDLEGDLAIDTETMGLNLHRDRLCLVQFSVGDGNAYIVQFDGKDYSATNLCKLFNDPKRVKIFHYGRFDIAVLMKHLNVNFENIFCTKIASKLTRTYTDHHGLKELCRELIGVSLSKQQQSSNWSARELSNEQQEYAGKDVIYLHLLREKLEAMLQSVNRHQLAQDLFKFLPIRARLDLSGWNDIDIFAHH